MRAGGPERTAQGTVSASPLLADGKLYSLNEDAVTTVLAAGPEFRLLLMSARGTAVYPSGSPFTDTVGWWRCRFVAADGGTVEDAAILRLLDRVGERMVWAHVQKLRVIEGETGFTKAQGQ